METKLQILNAVKVVGITVLTIGISIFLYGFFVSDYSAITGIGIGTVMGAIFIFLMGVFFVATEEMAIARVQQRKCCTGAMRQRFGIRDRFVNSPERLIEITHLRQRERSQITFARDERIVSVSKREIAVGDRVIVPDRLF